MSDQPKRRFKDETGNRYGMLRVLRFDEMRNGQPFFACRCECSQQVSVRGANLRSGNTASCGCSRRNAAPTGASHGSIQMQILCGRRVWGTVKDRESKEMVCLTSCRSCGDLKYYKEKRLRKRRGLRCKCYEPTYNSWRKMIERCTYKGHRHYADYGGRGITVSPRWRRNFWAFVGDIGTRPKGKTLDRKNNDEGYYLDNCRWATRKEQAQNRRPREKK
jgi:hypothetical protein